MTSVPATPQARVSNILCSCKYKPWHIFHGRNNKKKRSVTSGVLQWPILGPILLNNFINDIDSGTECTFSKLVVDSKWSGAADTFEGRNAIQEGP